MNLYVWVTPAFVKRVSPVDHTWVTTYDSQVSPFSSLTEVLEAQENYWFSWGSFHSKGNPRDFPGGLLLQTTTNSNASLCLVAANDPKGRGTIQWYGIHGVCHQLSNQILYPTGKNVSGARGYRLSSTIFGTFGRRDKEWNKRRIHCHVAPMSVSESSRTASLLVSRAAYLLGADSGLISALENLRLQLLHDIDDIGFAVKDHLNNPKFDAT